MSNLNHLSDQELLNYYFKFKSITKKSKRTEGVKVNNFDCKYSAHAVRLADECEQVLEFGDLDLRRAKEHLKAIRKGEVPLEDIKKWLFEKERRLDRLYESSKLRNTPDNAGIKQLLIDCLEQYFGNLSEAEFVNPDKYKTIYDQIKEIVS